MKYYNELYRLENELIRLETLTSLISVMLSGFENSTDHKDLQNCFYLLEENIKSVNNNLRNEFQNLWDVIRQDSFDDFDDVVNFDDAPEEADDANYDFDSINSVVKSWAKS